MASYALIPILSGFEFDMPNKYLGFKPYVTDEFRSIWSVDGVWGEFNLDKKIIIKEIEKLFENTIQNFDFEKIKRP